MPQDILNEMETLADKSTATLIGSIAEDGSPSIKAMMQPRMRDGLRTFYFATDVSSQHVAQYRADSRACLYFFRKSLFSSDGLLLTGTMEILDDAITKKAIWQPADGSLFKQGLNDPAYCVLKFTAASGRYYSDKLSKDFIV